ncbi:MAG: Npt1/Npt2 family nucleotide transporter [Chlamydiota bacterium]|nr:Npt1/Npt2 family nucleotide transporter [Chlamydiota bacterium]
MADSQEKTPEFGRLRSLIWPIHRHELKKLIPMLLIFFFITFNYNVLRTMKDTLVVTAESSGAEVIPFIKVWFMFPGSVLMAFLFTRLSNRFSQETVFHSIVALFIAFFVLFTFVLYPNRDYLHPNELCDRLQATLPLGLRGLIAAFRNWTFTLFYVMSEVWGNIVLSLLMWGFVNQVTRLGEASRFYTLFGVGINSSGIIAGYLSVKMSQVAFNPNLPFGETAWEQSMLLLIGTVVIVGVVIMGLFRWLNCYVVKAETADDGSGEKGEPKDVRGRISMRDSFRYLFKSKYLTNLAIIVITYNIVINLVEVVWKHQVKTLYPNQQDYNLYMSYITMIMGMAATFTSMFLAGNLVRRLGWSFTAMLTPVILFSTSILFFGAILANMFYPELLYSMTGVAPLAVVVFLGSLQNILSRSAKYTVFDETREMALIPLSAECKLKGKAVIDGVCSRLGKSTGAFAHQSLLIVFSSIAISIPYVTGILFSVIGLWMFVTRQLGKEFNDLTANSKDGILSSSNGEEKAEDVNVELQEQPA